MDYDATQEELDSGLRYENLFVPAVFAHWTRHLVDAAEVKKGSHILDIACGSGVLARHTLSRTGQTGRVVGVDPAPGMLAAAKELEPGIEWVLRSAEDLDFADATFDCVLSQFGMMFFQDRQKAAGEMYRVTKPGGALAIAVWNAIEHNPAYGDITAVLDEQASVAAGDVLRLPFSLGDPEDVTKVLAQSGFTDIQVETKIEEGRFPSIRTMVEADIRGWLPLFDINLGEEKITNIVAKSNDRLSKYANRSGEVVFPTSAHVFSARKPQ